MARNAPQITVKDLTNAMRIQDQKTRTEIASQSGGNRLEDMTGYGKDWPGTMKDQGFGDEPGTDPAEMIQLELPLDLVKKLQIMAQENPEIAQGITDELMIAGNPSFDINETPATRRIRKIRTLQERGVGGEKGNAGDILKKGIQLPNLQANINESIQRENVGGTLLDMMLPLLIKEYGKDSGGSYKNPSKLLSGMKKLAQGRQETIGPDPVNPTGTDLFIRPSDQRRIKNHDKYFGSKLA
tara:strand:+ start:37 stop:759 length:723 start_codon:yes stop_codon:yes gene_type:complete